MQTYRADVDVDPIRVGDTPSWCELGSGIPACRCYRCAALLTVDTVTSDRIVPGCQGGTYRRNNIRPACGGCNSETGGALRSTGRRVA